MKKKGIIKRFLACVVSLATAVTVSGCTKKEDDVKITDFLVEEGSKIEKVEQLEDVTEAYYGVIREADKLHQEVIQNVMNKKTTQKVTHLISLTMKGMKDMNGKPIECQMLLDVKAANGKDVVHALTFNVREKYALKINQIENEMRESGYTLENVENYLKSVQVATRHAEDAKVTTGLVIPEVQTLEATVLSAKAKDRIFNFANSVYSTPDSESYDLAKSAEESKFYTENKSNVSDMTISVQSKSKNRYATVTMVLDDKVYSVLLSSPVSDVRDNDHLKEVVIKYLNNPEDQYLKDFGITITVESAGIADRNDTAIWDVVKEVTNNYEAAQTNEDSANV